MHRFRRKNITSCKDLFLLKSDKIEWIAGDLFEDWKTHIYQKQICLLIHHANI